MFYSVEIEVTGLSIQVDEEPIVGLVTWRNTCAVSKEKAIRLAKRKFVKEEKFVKLIAMNNAQNITDTVAINTRCCKKIGFKDWVMSKKMGFCFYCSED